MICSGAPGAARDRRCGPCGLPFSGVCALVLHAWGTHGALVPRRTGEHDDVVEIAQGRLVREVWWTRDGTEVATQEDLRRDHRARRRRRTAPYA